MAYGYSRFRKSSTRSASVYGRGLSRIPKVAYRKKTGYYTKNMKGEKKYYDKTYQCDGYETLTGTANNALNNGVTYVSSAWQTYTFGARTTAVTTSNDMFKGLATGTDARTRIGNKIRPRYIKGAFTFTAAVTNASQTKVQQGEQFVWDAVNQNKVYMRTTYRMLLVKDLQVNSADAYVSWSQVMDTSNFQAGVHSELNVNNMGRFIILEDKMFTVDAQNPQKTVQFMVKGSKTGPVRYNGPDSSALTDKGLYVVWAAFTLGVGNTSVDNIEIASPVGHSRVCFSDE